MKDTIERYVFRGPCGALYGVTPELADHPEWSAVQAVEFLARTYGDVPAHFELLRVELVVLPS